MTNQTNLASLLASYMQSASIGDARLANQVNSINGNPCFIHRSTVRNWRTGSAQKVQSWQQLATIAIALGLNETETNDLLISGGCLSLQALASTEKVADQALLAHWQSNSADQTEAISSAQTQQTNAVQFSKQGETPAGKKGFILPEINVRKFITAKRNLVAGVVALFGFFSLGYYQYNTNESNMLVNSHFENGTVGWISYVNDAAAADFKVYNGALHIQLDQPTNTSWHIGLNQKDLEVTAGKFYTARFRVRGDGVTSMYVDITRVVNPKTSLSFDNSKQQKVTTTKDWAVRTIEFNAIETITAKDGGARLFFRFGNSEKGKIVLDDIELFEGKLAQATAAPQS